MSKPRVAPEGMARGHGELPLFQQPTGSRDSTCGTGASMTAKSPASRPQSAPPGLYPSVHSNVVAPRTTGQ